MKTVTKPQVTDGQVLTNHTSMENEQSNEPLTLMDCFSAFTQRYINSHYIRSADYLYHLVK